MFATRHIPMHLATTMLQLETVGPETRSPVAVVGLTLEPLTQALAREISPEVAEHCFTKSGKLRLEVRRLVIKNPTAAFAIEARMAADVAAHAVLRNVRIPTITISKRGEAKEETGAKGKKKAKKVKPALEVLRASLRLLVGIEHREFFCERFGDTLMFSFAPEAPSLLDQPPANVPGMADGAGDVLDEQRELGLKKPKGPRLVRGAKKAADAAPADPS